MAARFNASGDILKRTASLPSPASFTMTGWAVRRADTNYYTTVASLRVSETAGVSRLALETGADGDTLLLSHFGNHGTVLTMSNDAWFYWALRCNGTTAYAHAAAIGDAALTTSSIGYSSLTIGVLVLGDRFTSGGEYLNGSIAAVKVWDTALTEAEILAERWTYLPKRYADLHAVWPVVGSTTTIDLLGAKPLTSAGTLDIEDGPPISWGAPIILPMLKASTAPVLSLPGVQSITATSAVPKVTITF